ncbi:glycosyltransferase family 2 protein [Dyadobacter sandarakinus]|uniref:Glycosyltransferase family 2 protein n=2 Tax=Dyadobacter sandarakinus TaxID=2747268 RepID=A0ABX7ID61_9BACT|nr:glycosyltransferase family 2 protein [Dyadobacter sandarakinus]
MENAALVSIALCTYNGAEFLELQLQSVIAQSFKKWQLVVVDDCSTDETWNILQRYAGADERISLHRNADNMGYNRNFEKAVQLCDGDYIAICDQDDVWHPDKLQTQLNAMSDHQLVYHDSALIDQHGKPMHVSISERFNFYRGSEPEVFLYMNCVSGHTILMKRSLLQRALPFPHHFHYDQWLAFVAAGTGSIDFIPENLVQYRQHRNNNTDLLALHVKKRSAQERIRQLEREEEWLALCSRLGETHRELIGRLWQLCRIRNNSFMNLRYGIEIWKNRRTLLYLLKKPATSKFFYTLRKIWGRKAKVLA